MINLSLVFIGLIIRWLFYYENAKRKISDKKEVFSNKKFIADNKFLFIYTSVSAFALYHSLPSLFSSLNCNPCNNEFTFLSIGYINHELIKFLYNAFKAFIKNKTNSDL
jgi:hypothetical protein